MSATATNANDVRCPKCNGPTWFEVGGKFWGNGLTSNGKPKPTHKCKDKACGGAVWQKNAQAAPPRQASAEKKPVSIGTTGVALLDDQAEHEDATLAELQRQEGWVEIKRRYTEAVSFVMGMVPTLTKADVGVSPESFASMVATVFIQRMQKGV